jgi:phosphoribosylformylglycinamidine synthase
LDSPWRRKIQSSGRRGKYNIPVKYAYASYPGLPSGSDFNAAAICSDDGRHLAIMPHLERAFFPWQCGTYPNERKNDDVTPMDGSICKCETMD